MQYFAVRKIDRSEETMRNCEVGPWLTLPSEGGGSVALDGERLAVSSQAHLSVWRNEARIASVDATWPFPGLPRFSGERVYWGPGFLELSSGRYTSFDAARPAARPGGGERPVVYAWSPHGDCFVGSFSTGDASRPVRVTSYDGQSGAHRARVVGRTWSPAAGDMGWRSVIG